MKKKPFNHSTADPDLFPGRLAEIVIRENGRSKVYYTFMTREVTDNGWQEQQLRLAAPTGKL